MHENVSTLMLKKVWNPSDDTLFLKDHERFTSEGLKSYWEAVDRTVRYFDSVVLPKRQGNVRKTQKKMFDRHAGDPGADRFRWQNPKLNSITATPVSFRKLLPPV